MKDIIIIGAGGLGREVLWLIERINKLEPVWRILGFLDDNDDLSGKLVNGCPVLGSCLNAEEYSDAYFVCAVGSSKIRKKIITKLKDSIPDVKFATLVDPSVEMSETVTLGEGTIVCAHTIMTVNLRVGEHCIVNLDCTIGHDAELKDFVSLYPSVNISGFTKIGECSEIGAGSVIIQYKEIGNNTIVGAGAVVIRDIPDNCTAVGCPAEPISFF